MSPIKNSFALAIVTAVAQKFGFRIKNYGPHAQILRELDAILSFYSAQIEHENYQEMGQALVDMTMMSAQLHIQKLPPRPLEMLLAAVSNNAKATNESSVYVIFQK